VGAEVTPEALVEKGVLKNTRTDVKILGNGELTKSLSVTAHAVSASAREKIEGAGGSVTLLREPKEPKPKRRWTRQPAGAAEAEPVEEEPVEEEPAAEEESPEEEPAAEEES
jgi:hypothetical protein